MKLGSSAVTAKFRAVNISFGYWYICGCVVLVMDRCTSLVQLRCDCVRRVSHVFLSGFSLSLLC